MPPHPPDSSFGDARDTANVARFFARAAALPVEVCLRRFGTWGDRYLGVASVFGLFWPLVFGAFYGPARGLAWLTFWWFVVLGLLLVHRVAGVVRRVRGYECHSRYAGDSWFLAVPGFGDPQRAYVLEVLTSALVAGVLAELVSKPLGAMLLVSTLAHAVNLALAHLADAARLRAMRDAEIEYRYYLALYRRKFPDDGR
jgi:hypothetical protein